jgi:hypothetical protein
MAYPTENGQYWYWDTAFRRWEVRRLGRPTPVYGEAWQWGPKVECPEPPLESVPTLNLEDLTLVKGDLTFWYAHEENLNGDMVGFLFADKPLLQKRILDSRDMWASGFPFAQVEVPEELKDIPCKDSLRRLIVDRKV